MALIERTLSVQLFVCDFCGTTHGSIKEAEGNGCTHDYREALYKVGDTTTVGFKKVAGMEVVGTQRATGKVTNVLKPSDITGEPSSIVSRLGDFNENMLALHAVRRQHEWLYEIEPVTSDAAAEKHLIGGVFYESEIY